jgi:hypothetical protein
MQGAFDPARAKENADFLIATLGTWVTRPPAGPKPHRLPQAWQQSGPDPYLQLNRLAEDLRVLEAVPGLPQLLRDLKTVKRFEPTLHEIHTAALFQRGGQPVTKFYNPLSESAPDFDVNIGARVPVEAKQLMLSGASRLFSSRAWQLQEELTSTLQNDSEFPEAELILVVKDRDAFPDSATARPIIQAGIERLLAGAVYRSPQMNLVARPLPPSAVLDRRLTLHLVGATDPTEDERVEGLIKKANRQLRTNADGQSPGIACVALRELQDPQAIADLIKRKFHDAQFRSTSAVLLHRYASFSDPNRSSIADALVWLPNENAHVPITKNVHLKGPELTGPLFDLPSDGSVSCYSISSAHGRVIDATAQGGLFLNPIYRLRPELLQ